MKNLLPLEIGSPQFAAETEFNFNQRKHNRAIYNSYKDNVRKVIKKDEDEYIFIAGTREEGAVIGYDLKESYMFFISEFKLEKGTKSAVGANVMQTAVWKSIDTKYRGHPIVKDTIFNILLKEYANLMTDKMQTTLGQLLWGNLITEAPKRGYYVYLVNAKRKIVYGPRVGESVDQFWNRTQKFVYGYTENYKRYRYLISRYKW